MTDVPVLIVGGGLTGLSAALFLGTFGIRSLVVERRQSTTTHPKARGLNARTMELFRGIGLERRVLTGGADLSENSDILVCRTLADPPLDRVVKSRNDLETSRVSPSQECLCPQDILEPILVDAARRRGAVVDFQSELQHFDQDGDGVTATIDGHLVHADYLVACDGAGSGIRDRLGITMRGDAPTFHSLGIAFSADLAGVVSPPFILAYITHPDASGVLLPINNRDRWIFHVRFDPARGESAADFTADRCNRLIRTATGRPDLRIELTQVREWTTTCAIADRYRENRIFIAGDAAHLFPPAGALGANTAIQDVHNLAWKLAFVLKGLAGASLLDTYEAERLSIGQMTMEQALLRWHSMERGTDPGFLDDLEIMFGSRYISRAVLNSGPLYPSQDGLDRTPGTRAPHIWLNDGSSTLDLFGPEFTVLYGRGEWAAAARGLKQPVKACHVDVRTNVALLIRPDGYVAWRGEDPSQLATVLAEILDSDG